MRRPSRQRVRGIHLPAPTGGINAVDPLSLMPATDAVLQTNLVPAEKGLRPRSGTEDWITTWGGLSGDVRSLAGFPGSTAAKSKLWGFSAGTIADIHVKNGGSAGLSFTFRTNDATSGYGVAAVFANATAHYMLYCDETNGYHVWTEALSAGGNYWEEIVSPGVAVWQASHAYAVGDKITNDGGKTYVCAVAGTSAAGPATGPAGTGVAPGALIADGTAFWRFTLPISGVDPRELVFVTQWKNRVWFVRKNTAEAYYLEPGAIYGAATKFDFGGRFPHGGTLVGLWSWTIDGGQGVDDHLVAISSSGDVLVYKGTDPASAETFAQVGSWYLGGIPAGRNIALAFGGDLLVLSKLGVIPLSRLIAGGEVSDPTIYATAKIRPLFARLVAERGHLRGWHMNMNPEDGTLVVAVPDEAGTYTEQYAFSLARKSWAKIDGIPMLCSAVWNGKLYAGQPDEQVQIIQGTKDDVAVDGTGGTAIEWSLLTSFQNLGGPNWKRVQNIRPRIVGTALVNVAARYDYDASEPSGAVSAPTLTGATGIGSAVAVALNGSSSEACTLVGFDVQYEEGGLA